jgi:hypothetical protein
MRIKQWKLLAPFMHHKDEKNGNGGKSGAAPDGAKRSRSLFHTFFNF